MRRVILLLMAATGGAYAQGWTQLMNTRMHNPTGSLSVCPPDNFQPIGGGMPSYSFNGLCFGKITDWSSAAIDTKRSRIVIWGGGHLGYRGNEAYSVDLVTPSATSATCGTTGASCTISTNVSVPTMTRLNNPSAWQSDCSDEADGSLQAEHTWGAFLYLPKHDKFFSWLGGHYCGSGYPNWLDTRAWTMDPTTAVWTKKADASTLWGGGGGTYSGGAACVVDPTTAHETVLCLASGHAIYRYDVDADVWSTVIGYNALPLPGNVTQTAASLVIDPDRKLLFAIGSSITAPDFPTPAIYSLNLVDWTGTDWTSSVSGCDDLMGYAYPSVVWDPTIHKIVGYVPRTVASSNPDNRVIVFDPAMHSCVTQPFTGGPIAADAILARNGSTSEHGMFGRFGYVPALRKYVVVNNFDGDAYTFALHKTPVHGLGATADLTTPATKYQCVDRDGDGYGTGPGCLGPDADDLDVDVHSSTQFLTKWTDLPTGLKHLGYNTTNIWYIASASGSPAGNDTTADGTIAHPYASCCGSGRANPAPGDAVILLGGTYSATWWNYSVGGAAGHPIIYMAYPGQRVLFDTYPAGFDFMNQSYMVVDGFAAHANGSNACINVGLANHVAVKHIEAWGCLWGVVTEYSTDLTIEDSALYDNTEHGAYVTNHDHIAAYDIFVRRNICWGNIRTCNQINGEYRNVMVEQNIAFNNGAGQGTGAFSWFNGVSHSEFRDNLSINNPVGLTIWAYSSWCDAYYPSTPCPVPQNYNTFENFTHYRTTTDGDGNPFGASFAAVSVSSSTTTTADNGHNAYRNIAMATNYGSGTAPITFDAKGFESTSTFDGIRAYNLYSPSITDVFQVGSSVYSCTSIAGHVAGVSNCSWGNPGFTSLGAWDNIPAFDLRPAVGSALAGTGVMLAKPTYDVVGNLRSPTLPSLGAYEYQGAAPCSLSPSSLGPYTAGQVVSNTLVPANCSTSTCSVTSGTLTGSGLSLGGSQNCVLSGTAVAGSFTATVGYDTASNPYSVTINAAPSVTSSSLAAGTQGVPYDQTIATTGGTGTVTCAGSGAPAGLSINSNCHVTGTPSASGTFTLSVTVTDSLGVASPSHNVGLVISGGSGGTPAPGTFSLKGTIH